MRARWLSRGFPIVFALCGAIAMVMPVSAADLDSEETLREQAMALAEEQAPDPQLKGNVLLKVEQVTQPPFVGGAYTTPLTNPWTSSEIFSAGTWITEAGGGGPQNINVTPLSLSSTQAQNVVTQEVMTIGNTGDQALTWSIVEEPDSVVVSAGGGLAPRPPAAGAVGARGYTPDATPPIEYESPEDFAEGFNDITLLPGLGWFFQNNSQPLGSTEWFQGDDTAFPAHAGAPTAYIAANFDNTSGGEGTISNWMLTPQIALADGGTISFWTRTVSGSLYPDRLEVRLSTAGSSTNVGTLATDVGDFTTLLLSINPTLALGGYPEVWTRYTATLAGIPGGAAGRVGFRYWVTDGGPVGNNSNYIGIDTVEYASSAPSLCQSPADVPWLSEAPVGGTTAGGAATPVQVSFDSTGLPIGTYNANLCVTSDDPDPGPGNGTDLVIVPVELNVIPGANPSISLVKTVGTVAGVCATTDAITVVAGTTVYYCCEVTNTGDVTLYLHDLVDDQLGTLFTGLLYSLAPGASVNTVQAFRSIPAVINTTTTNTATWTAYVAGGPSAQATDTATVTAIPPRCPTGYEQVTLLTEGFEGGFPPAGWAVLNNGGACVWTNTDPGARGNLTGGAGLFAIADSDACGSGSIMNTDMRTPVLDLTGMIDPLVSYWTDYNDIGTGGDIATLEVSTDGGGTWVSVLTWDEDHRGPLFVEQAIPGAGENDVMIRWNYTDATYDWWWEVDDVVVTACMSEIMPEPLVCDGPTVAFDAGPPADWTVIDNAGSGVVWTSIAGSGEAGNYTNGSGDAASVSSDVFGMAEFDTELRTPPIDTTGWVSVHLSYTANYQNYTDLDYLDVDVSTDGGSSWTTVLSWNEDHGTFRSPPGEDVVLDISAVADDQPSVILRWHYYDPNWPDWDWYAQIDNAALICDEIIPVELMGISVE